MLRSLFTNDKYYLQMISTFLFLYQRGLIYNTSPITVLFSGLFSLVITTACHFIVDYLLCIF